MDSFVLNRAMAYRYFLTGAAAHVLLWTLVPALTFDAPPLDVAENIMWGREWLWGTYKHPPLQAWITEIALALSGQSLFGILLASQICIVLTWLALFRLALEVSTPQVALGAVALFALVYYCTIPSVELNANVIQMPIWTWAFYMLWRCMNDGRLADWIWLGILCALAVYAKYSAAILFLTMLIAVLATPGAWRALLKPAPWIGVMVASVLVAPHLYWLAGVDYLPISYAEVRSRPSEGLDRFVLALKFLSTQVLDHAAPLLLLVIACGLAPFRWTAIKSSFSSRNGRLLAIFGFVPLLLTVAWAIGRGVQVKDMWAAPMVSIISLWLAMQAPTALSPVRLRRAAYTGLILFVLAPIGVGTASLLGPALGAKPQKTAWPQAEITDRLTAIWQSEIDRPLKIVAGPTWPAALVIAGLGKQASGFIDCDFTTNPWISSGRLAEEGALVVWSGSARTACMDKLVFYKSGQISVTPRFGASRPITIMWAIHRPGESGTGDGQNGT